MGSSPTRINMKANECLRSLTYTTLNTVKKIVSTIWTALFARHYYFKTILFELSFARIRNLPSKISLTLSIALSTRIRAAMTWIKRYHTNTS